MKDYLHEIARELVPVLLVMALAAGCGAISREETLIGEAEVVELRAVHETRQTALCAGGAPGSSRPTVGAYQPYGIAQMAGAEEVPHPSPSATPSPRGRRDKERTGGAEDARRGESEPRATQEPEPDAEELDMLACVIYQEAGGDYIADDTRRRVGDVVLNRMADEGFPASMREVLMQEGQYGRFHQTGIVWPERAERPGEAHAVERAKRIARELLTDEQHSELYGAGYIWQSEFEQGTDVVYVDGIFFGR